MGPLQGWRSRRCCGELRLGVVAPRGFVRNHFFVNDLKKNLHLCDALFENENVDVKLSLLDPDE